MVFNVKDVSLLFFGRLQIDVFPLCESELDHQKIEKLINDMRSASNWFIKHIYVKRLDNIIIN